MMSYPTVMAEFKEIIQRKVEYDTLKRYGDRYHEVFEFAANEILQSQGPAAGKGDQSILLYEIEEILANRLVNGAILLLSIQAGSIPDTCIFSFVDKCLILLQYVEQLSPSAQKDFCHISNTLALIACNGRFPGKILYYMLSACNAMKLTDSISSFHADILQVCISARHYELAVNFIDSLNISELNLKSTFIRPVDFLRFYFYAGTCYAAISDYESALECFTQAIITPVGSLSEVAIDSYKRARLISLISRGKSYVVDRCAPPAITQYSQTAIEPYSSIEALFLEKNADGLKSAIEAFKDLLTKDNNLGIAKLLIPAIKNFQLQDISKVYSSLSISEVSKQLNFSEELGATRFLLEQIQQRKVNATIDFEKGFIYFTQKKSDDDIEYLNADLRDKLREVTEISVSLRRKHSEILQSNNFVSKALGLNLEKGPHFDKERQMGLRLERERSMNSDREQAIMMQERERLMQMNSAGNLFGRSDILEQLMLSHLMK